MNIFKDLTKRRLISIVGIVLVIGVGYACATYPKSGQLSVSVPVIGGAVKTTSQPEPTVTVDAVWKKFRTIEDRLTAIENNINKILELAQAEVPTGDTTPATVSNPVARTALVNSGLGKCAACHHDSDKAAKGNEFILIEGSSPRQLSNPEVDAVMERLEGTSKPIMPPKKAPPHVQLTDEERQALKEYYPTTKKGK